MINMLLGNAKPLIKWAVVGAALWNISPAYAAQHCADNYSIDKTLANGARWDMCWTHNNNHGIRYHHIYYTPKNGTRRMVLRDASIAQVHVPYDDNGARYHDVSDYGLGGGYLRNMSSAECSGGTLHRYGTKNALCSQLETQGPAYRTRTHTAAANALKVFSISKVGAYIYIPQWLFYDDGRIGPSMLATGSLQRFGGNSVEAHGWRISDLNGGSRAIGLAHMHNYFWRLDFDLNGTANNDVVEEINYQSVNGKRQRSMTPLNTEAARALSPSTQRSWLIRDSSAKNTKGHFMGYEVRLDEAGHREIGPSNEQFTYNDFYVTKAKSCEQIASHNRRVNSCATDSLDQFVNGESLSGQDLVAWVGVSFYHMPRSEDYPKMDAHSNHFQLIPRDWHAKNPLKTVAVEQLIAGEDSAITEAGESVTIDVLANDTGTGIFIHDLNDPAHGTAVIEDGKVVYTPDAGYAGTDVFWYAIKDMAGNPYGTKITVTVSGVNTNAYPEGVEDLVTTAAGESVTIDVLANDQGAGLEILEYNTSSYQGGTVTQLGERLIYTPRTGFAGEDVFWYAFKDNQGRTNSTKVTITVTGVDAGAYPTGSADAVSTAKNTPATFDVLANDTGVDLTLFETNPWTLRGGTATIQNNKIVYTPKADFVGEDTLWYVLKDVAGRTNSAEVTITVTETPPAYPVAIADYATTSVDTAITIDVLDNDTGSALSIAEVNEYSAGGTVAIVGDKLRYTPNAGFTGSDSFWYAIRDSLGRLNAIQVFVEVNP